MKNSLGWNRIATFLPETASKIKCKPLFAKVDLRYHKAVTYTVKDFQTLQGSYINILNNFLLKELVLLYGEFKRS